MSEAKAPPRPHHPPAQALDPFQVKLAAAAERSRVARATHKHRQRKAWERFLSDEAKARRALLEEARMAAEREREQFRRARG